MELTTLSSPHRTIPKFVSPRSTIGSSSVDQSTFRDRGRRPNPKITRHGRGSHELSGREPRIGVVISRYGSSYFGRMLDGAGEWLQRNGCHAIVQASNVTGYGERRAWNSLLDCNCDGIIVHSDRLSDSQLTSMFGQHHNAVLMNRIIPGLEARCVYIDNEAGGRMAADYLIEQGHRDIAMITGPRVSGPRKYQESAAREQGFTDRLHEAGLSMPDELIIEGNFQHECGVDGLEKLLATGKLFSAIFAHNDEMAAGALRACRAHSINVPDQMSIIGFDDLDLARVISPKLTTVRQPEREIGARAARILHRMISGTETDEILPENFCRIVPELIVRDSVRDMAGSAGKVHRANELLTTREIECLQWTAAGKTSGSISILLSISESTVNFHLKNVLEKLDASNRTHAVAIAISRSLIAPL